MLPKLIETEKFIKDVQILLQKISSLKNEKIREKLIEDVNRLKKFADEIDVGHDTRFNGMIHPSRLSDTREKMVKLRESIQREIKRQEKI